MRAEQLTGPVAEHGEGPVWSPSFADGTEDGTEDGADDGAGHEWAGLRWVDLSAGDVLSLGPDGAVHRRGVGSIAAMLRPRAGGGTVVAVERGLLLLDADGTTRQRVELVTEDGIRLNEGGAGPDGHLFVGSMAYDSTPGAGTLWRVTPSLEVSVVLPAVTVSNGIAWSPDGALAYYADSPTGRIDVLDHADGALTGRRPFAEIDAGDGVVPDGLTVDADGRVWVALYGGSAVRCYEPDGRLAEVVEVPVSQPTACTFAGPDLDRLVITTTKEGLEDGAEPAAGALFVATPGVRGLPALPFAG